MVTADLAGPLAIPAPPGYGRAHARETVVFRDRGVLVTGKRAWWRPMYPGTGDAYPGPLFATKDSETPMTFPAQTERDGIIEVWAPEPVRLELSVWADHYPGQSVIVTLLFTEDTEGVVLLEDHLADPDPHTQYVLAAGDAVTGPLVVQGNLVDLDPDPNNVLSWGAGGLMSLGATIDAYTKVEADAKFVDVAGDSMTGDLNVDGRVAATGDLSVDLTGYFGGDLETNADLISRNKPVAVSPDAANTLEWRQNGFYSGAPTQAQYEALLARVAALEAQMAAHIHAAGDWDFIGGTSVPDGTP